MADEAFRDKDTFDVRAVTNVKKHIRNTCSGRLLEGRQNAPDLVHLFFHNIFFIPDPVAFLICSIHIRVGWFQLLAGRRKANIPEFVNHVALRMPMLILAIAEDFHELFQNGGMTAVASLSKLSRIMVMTVHFVFVLVI